MYTKIVTSSSEAKLEERLNSEPEGKNGLPDNYAVLISGLTESRHLKNMILAYNTLLYLGFQEQNIYVLDSKGAERLNYKVDGPATKSAIEKVFSHLKSKTDSEDFLFTYVTNHGGRSSGESTIALPGPDVGEETFENFLSGMEVKKGVLVFDQCYGGGFAKRLGKGRFVAVSASHPGENSIDNSFPQAFFNSFNYAVGDMNGDGLVSIEEAFNYALRHDMFALRGMQHPMIVSDLSPGRIFLKDRVNYS